MKYQQIFSDGKKKSANFHLNKPYVIKLMATNKRGFLSGYFTVLNTFILYTLKRCKIIPFKIIISVQHIVSCALRQMSFTSFSHFIFAIFRKKKDFSLQNSTFIKSRATYDRYFNLIKQKKKRES